MYLSFVSFVLSSFVRLLAFPFFLIIRYFEGSLMIYSPRYDVMRCFRLEGRRWYKERRRVKECLLISGLRLSSNQSASLMLQREQALDLSRDQLRVSPRWNELGHELLCWQYYSAFGAFQKPPCKGNPPLDAGIICLFSAYSREGFGDAHY